MDVTQVLWPDSSPFAQYLASQGRDDVLETFAAVSTSAPGGSAAVPKDSRLGKYCTTAIAPETCALINPWLERCLVLTAPKSSSSDATRVDDSATLSVSAGMLVRLCVSALLLAIAVYSAVASSDCAWHAQLDSVALCGFTLISAAVLAAYLNLCWHQYRAVTMWAKCALIVEASAQPTRPARDLLYRYDELVRRSLRMIAELELAARGYRLYATWRRFPIGEISASWAVVSRLDQASTSFVSSRLRAALRRSLQLHLDLMDELAAASTSVSSFSVEENGAVRTSTGFRIPDIAFRFHVAPASDARRSDAIATIAELRALARSAIQLRTAVVSSAFSHDRRDNPTCSSPSPSPSPTWLDEADEEDSDVASHPSLSAAAAAASAPTHDGSITVPQSSWFCCSRMISSIFASWCSVHAELQSAQSWQNRAIVTHMAIGRLLRQVESDSNGIELLLAEFSSSGSAATKLGADSLSPMPVSMPSTLESLALLDGDNCQLQHLVRASHVRTILLQQLLMPSDQVVTRNSPDAASGASTQAMTSESARKEQLGTVLELLDADLKSAAAHVASMMRSIGRHPECGADALLKPMNGEVRISSGGDDDDDVGETSQIGAALLATLLRPSEAGPAVFQHGNRRAAGASSSSSSSDAGSDESDGDYQDRPVALRPGASRRMPSVIPMFSELNAVLRHRGSAAQQTLVAEQSRDDSDSEE